MSGDLRNFGIVCLAAFALVSRGFASESPVDFSSVQSEIKEEKGRAVTSSTWSFTEGHSLVWDVETSAAEEFDFARLTMPCDTKVTEDSVLVLSADLTLSPENFLDVELVTDNGELLYTAIKEPVGGNFDYRLPVKKFSAGDGAAIALPATIKAVQIMISGDKSSNPGSNHLALGNLTIE